jgi:hypothetical protein
MTTLEAGNGISVAIRIVSTLAAFAVALMFLDRGQVQERAAERRALEARAHDLSARATAPGSPLGCLDAAAGEIVENSCEKALFASPESTAAAVEYVSARLALVLDEIVHLKGNADSIRGSQAALRRTAERDRFGFYAHVLAVRYGCDDRSCGAFPLFNDLERIKANLQERRFDGLVERYAATWPKGASPQVPGTPQASAPSARPTVSRGIDFPSAASIPPVSIMNPEPVGSAGAAAMAPPGATFSTPQNRPPAPGQMPARRQATQSLAPPTPLSPPPEGRTPGPAN